jgi:RHS repeat-associated protein
VLAEVDPSGVVTAGRKYDVYRLVRTGQAGISKHKFVGKLGHMNEDETGLIYMRARYMDPVLGKFTSEDPAKDGGNWYVYCDNNPVDKLDSNGKKIIRIGDFWIRWDEPWGNVPKHVHWGRGNVELGSAFVDGSIHHKNKLIEYPSRSEMEKLKKQV